MLVKDPWMVDETWTPQPLLPTDDTKAPSLPTIDSWKGDDKTPALSSLADGSLASKQPLAPVAMAMTSRPVTDVGDGDADAFSATGAPEKQSAVAVADAVQDGTDSDAVDR